MNLGSTPLEAVIEGFRVTGSKLVVKLPAAPVDDGTIAGLHPATGSLAMP